MQNETKMRFALQEGLEQAEVDFRLPNVFIHKHIYPHTTSSPPSRSISYVLESIQKNVGCCRPLLPLLLQAQFPVMLDDSTKQKILPGLSRMAEAFQAFASSTNHKNTERPHVVLAIGPEGGWTENELKYFVNKLGFFPVHMGPRILRTDLAILSALGIANELLELYFPVTVTSSFQRQT